MFRFTSAYSVTSAVKKSSCIPYYFTAEGAEGAEKVLPISLLKEELTFTVECAANSFLKDITVFVYSAYSVNSAVNKSSCIPSYFTAEGAEGAESFILSLKLF